MAKLTLNSIGSRYGSVDALNDNFDAIEQAIENTLSLDGTSPNALQADLDMNSNSILNAATIHASALVIGGQTLEPGDAVATATVQVFEFTATAGQTSFSVSPLTPASSGVLVEVNGLSLPTSSLVTSGSTLSFPALTLGDEVVVKVFTRDIGAYPAITNNEVAANAAIVSSKLAFTQAGTTQVRSVQDKMRDVVSVKDFGAVGNGIADDTLAIQAAINYVKTLVGGTVVFPYGNYRVTSSLSVAGNFGFAGVQLIGNNSRITSTANGPAITVDAYNGGGGASAEEYRINAVIDGFYFYGPGVASTASVGIKVLLSANVLIRNCAIRNFYKGLEGDGVLISRFEGLNISENFIGIDFNFTLAPVAFGCNDNHFIACRVWNNTKAIFYSTGGGGTVTFDYCEIEGNNLSSTGVTDGIAVIDLYLAGKVTFNGSYIEENRGQYNIKYVGNDATGSLNFIGTQFLLNGTTGYGIFLDNTAGVANSLTMIGCSLGTCATSDLHIGTGFSVFLMQTSVVQPITGSLEKLAVYRNGRYSSGAYTSTFAPMLLNGSANGNNIGCDVNGLLRFTDANGSTRYAYMIGGATTTGLLVDSGYLQLGLNSGTARVLIGRLGTATVEPYADNTHSLGTASYRWSVVYAGTGTINTSDERNKQDIASLDEAELRVAKALKGLVKKYRFKDAVAEKGDGARIHFGVIAQDVKAAFEAEDLDATRYGLLCYDQWDDHFEEVMDENGALTGEHKLVVAAGGRYGVRYDQLLAFIIAAL